jgi:3-hydroxyacyl-CoA dehydrogenase / enoyl-CoA hydratase / 3-hydroxybutyryl-CoA epimerase
MNTNNEFFRVETDDDGVATLTLEMADKPVNVFTQGSLEAFEAAVTSLIDDEAVKAVIIASAKPVFHVGADLAMAQEMSARAAPELFTDIMRINSLFRRIETGGTTFVAAINGHALGGGLELALACHARIVANNDRLQLGLPEAKVGLMPGFGGTQRLTRLTPLADALPAIATGSPFSPAKALGLGLVTEVCEPDQLLAAAKAWALANPKATQPWDRKGYKLPSGAIHSPANFQFFAGASAQYRKNTGGHYPAPAAILDAVYQGLQMPIDQALKVEARRFVSISRSIVARSMIKTLFFGMNDANALVRRPAEPPKHSFKTIGMVGAGLMGGGIAYSAARAGCDVILIDTSMEAAERGKAYSERLLDKAVSRGKLAAEKRASHLDRITTTTDFAALAKADLVVEAVFESKDVKQTALKAIEAAVGPTAIIASNTSTIPITELAAFLDAPERFIGMHFFSPVEKMPLVEIISGKLTSSTALAAAFDLCQLLKKTPVDVNDGRGFYTTRVVSSYMIEGMALLREGVSPALIENAGKAAGMPMGPLRLADMVNLDLAVKIADQTKADSGDAYVEHPGIAAARQMVALERLGEKSGKGFYQYQDDTRLWPDLATLFPLSSDQPDASAVTDRLLMIQAIETLRCFDDGVVKTAIDADLGSILGWGFPPHTGGIASYIDQETPSRLLEKAERLSKNAGARFEPPAGLRKLVNDNVSLHAVMA